MGGSTLRVSVADWELFERMERQTRVNVRSATAAVLLSAVAASCGSTASVSEPPSTDVAAPSRPLVSWADSGVTSYTMRYTSTCGENSYIAFDPVTAVVEDGVLVSSNGDAAANRVLTVEDVLGYIEEASAADRLEAEYGEFGQPMLVDIDVDIEATDDEFCVDVEEFVVTSGSDDSSVDTDAAPVPEDDAVLAERLAGTWYPFAVDGVTLDPAERDFWVFTGTDTALEISGYDGCNDFRTDDADQQASIVDGRLADIAIVGTAQDCGDGNGPFPETGALLTVSEDGATLTSDGPSGAVVLSRTAPEQVPANPADEALAEQLLGRWYPVSVDGVALDPAEGDFWSFSGTASELAITGFDGCNNFATITGRNGELSMIVDGRFAYLDFATEEQACDDVVSGPYPEVGALLTISDDGTTLTADARANTVVLSRDPATPEVGTDLPPAQEPDIATFDLSPPNPQPGETFEATFDPDNERGGYFTLEQWSGSEWLPATFLLTSDAGGGQSSWALAGEFDLFDYGVGGAGPDGLVMPDEIDAGVWRLCTANALDDVCAQLTVEP